MDRKIKGAIGNSWAYEFHITPREAVERISDDDAVAIVRVMEKAGIDCTTIIRKASGHVVTEDRQSESEN